MKLFFPADCGEHCLHILHMCEVWVVLLFLVAIINPFWFA